MRRTTRVGLVLAASAAAWPLVRRLGGMGAHGPDVEAGGRDEWRVPCRRETPRQALARHRAHAGAEARELIDWILSDGH